MDLLPKLQAAATKVAQEPLDEYSMKVFASLLAGFGLSTDGDSKFDVAQLKAWRLNAKRLQLSLSVSNYAPDSAQSSWSEVIDLVRSINQRSEFLDSLDVLLAKAVSFHGLFFMATAVHECLLDALKSPQEFQFAFSYVTLAESYLSDLSHYTTIEVHEIGTIARITIFT